MIDTIKNFINRLCNKTLQESTEEDTLSTDNSIKYRKWTDSEVTQLITLSITGYSDEEIGKLLGRTETSVYQKRLKIQAKDAS